jgi:hypothetical protein
MIQNVRVDYSGPNPANPEQVNDFISQIQDMLSDVADQINAENGTLVIKVYDGKRMTYSFENLTPDIMKKINSLARPH